jgi:hypothetical protein
LGTSVLRARSQSRKARCSMLSAAAGKPVMPTCSRVQALHC